MSRYVDAEWLIKESMPLSFSVQKWVNEVQIMTAPSIDIVRCKECKYASDNKVYGCMLNHFNNDDYHRMYADDFCSYGEREGE